MRFTHILAAIAIVLAVAGPYFYKNHSMQKDTLRYIPIGDSYTIGEGVTEAERWPNLLAVHMTASGMPTEIIANPARTGWTTQDALGLLGRTLC